jgi:hypothetical protein
MNLAEAWSSFKSEQVDDSPLRTERVSAAIETSLRDFDFGDDAAGFSFIETKLMSQ